MFADWLTEKIWMDIQQNKIFKNSALQCDGEFWKKNTWTVSVIIILEMLNLTVVAMEFICKTSVPI